MKRYSLTDCVNKMALFRMNKLGGTASKLVRAVVISASLGFAAGFGANSLSAQTAVVDIPSVAKTQTIASRGYDPASVFSLANSSGQIEHTSMGSYSSVITGDVANDASEVTFGSVSAGLFVLCTGLLFVLIVAGVNTRKPRSSRSDLVANIAVRN